MKLRAPSVPLITVDPYFSVWSPDTKINHTKTVHWTGKSNSIVGTVTVDGAEYSFLGYHRNLHKMNQISLDINALSTTAVFENDQITLTAVFTTPTLLDDYRLLTRPVSYLALSYESRDGQAHTVSVNVNAYEELCLDRPLQSPVITEEVRTPNGIVGWKMGNTEQKPLNRDGDDLRIDWGYFYLMSNGENVTLCLTEDHKQTVLNVGASLSEGKETLYFFAYDDIESIEYFGAHLRSYWNRDGQTITDAIDEAAGEYEKVMARCNTFSQKLYNDAFASGGEKYAELLMLAYRQVIAAHKLVLDENGEILYISKECFSNGCAATVDVSYPSIPLFLLYNPELVKGMLRPVYRFARSDVWTKEYKYDFAPHDVGRYPLLNGQVYGYSTRLGGMQYSKQMPVEECGNMLIMETNVALATGTAEFAAKNLDLLEGWCDYLIRYGTDPEHQLCTDDFAGHLAHNCNLSLKAIMGLRGMAILMKMLGKRAKSAKYKKAAEDMAAIWMQTALNNDGTSNLAFDQPHTYSMKYNMIWDKIWKTKLFSKEFMDAELADNKKHFNAYGMPLDNRTDYTKSDWLVWVASMSSSKKVFTEFIAPLWKAYNESPSRVPMTDWYDTISGRIVGFQHRTVQGGLYMRILVDQWKNKR